VYFGLTETDRRAWTNSIAAMFFTAGARAPSVAGLPTGMPMVAGGLPYADGIRESGAALVWFGGQPTSRMATQFDRLPIDTLIATASFSTFFADKLTELCRPATGSRGEGVAVSCWRQLCPAPRSSRGLVALRCVICRRQPRLSTPPVADRARAAPGRRRHLDGDRGQTGTGHGGAWSENRWSAWRRCGR
jgi:hypothetical protein